MRSSPQPQKLGGLQRSDQRPTDRRDLEPARLKAARRREPDAHQDLPADDVGRAAGPLRPASSSCATASAAGASTALPWTIEAVWVSSNSRPCMRPPLSKAAVAASPRHLRHPGRWRARRHPWPPRPRDRARRRRCPPRRAPRRWRRADASGRRPAHPRGCPRTRWRAPCARAARDRVMPRLPSPPRPPRARPTGPARWPTEGHCRKHSRQRLCAQKARPRHRRPRTGSGSACPGCPARGRRGRRQVRLGCGTARARRGSHRAGRSSGPRPKSRRPSESAQLASRGLSGVVDRGRQRRRIDVEQLCQLAGRVRRLEGCHAAQARRTLPPARLRRTSSGRRWRSAAQPAPCTSGVKPE